MTQRFYSAFRSFSGVWSWRLLRLTLGGCILGGGGITLGTSIICAKRINAIRTRTYTDDFHLNPEIFGVPYKKVTFSTSDNVKLQGWWLPATDGGNDSEKIIILMHPYNNNKSNLLGVASYLHNHGYSIFMFDFRSFCKEKQKQSIGYFEQFDASAAIKYVINNYSNNNKQIVVMGASLGGTVGIMSSFKHSSKISAIVTDCAFSSLNEILTDNLKQLFILPNGLINYTLYVMDKINEFWYGYSIDSISPITLLNNENFNIPMFFIHSELDCIVPSYHSNNMYNICKSNTKKLWIIPNIDHCGGYFDNPKKYMREIYNWLEHVLEKDKMDQNQS